MKNNHSGESAHKTNNAILIRRLWQLYAPYRLMLAGMILCMLVVGASDALLPWLFGSLLDSQLPATDSPISAKWLPAAFAAIIVLRATFTFSRAYLAGWMETTIQKTLREQATARVLAWPPQRATTTPAGDITSHIMFFTNGMAQSSIQVFINLVQETIRLTGYIALLLYLQWKMALILFIAMPFIILSMRYFRRRVKKQAGLGLEKTMQGTEQLNELSRLWRIIKLHSGEATEKTRASQLFSRLRGVQLRILIARDATSPIGQIILAVPAAIIIYYIVSALTAETITPGTVSAFLTAMLLMQIPVRNITRALIRWSDVAVTVQSVFNFIDAPMEKDEGKKHIGRAAGAVDFTDISFSYTDTAPLALDNLSLTIQPGETVALVGRSGSGKTTLANLLPRFCQPTAGTVQLDGDDIRDLTLSSLRQQITLVTQEPLLFDATVSFNIAYPDSDTADEEKINRALHAAAADDFVAALPQGIHTRIGENGANLSGGQRQRLALARAFYRDTPLIILDEATSALDSETEGKIKDALRRLLVGRTALIITHRFATIDFADRVAVLDQGKLIASGKATDLRQTCPLFAELYDAQKLEE